MGFLLVSEGIEVNKFAQMRSEIRQRALSDAKKVQMIYWKSR